MRIGWAPLAAATAASTGIRGYVRPPVHQARSPESASQRSRRSASAIARSSVASIARALTAFAGGGRLAPVRLRCRCEPNALLVALAAGVAAINGSWTNIENSFAGGGLGGLLVDTGGISAVVWFALYAVIAIAREESGALPSFRWTDAAVVAMLILASLIPTPLPASFAVLLAGSYFLVLPATPAERRIGTILLALTGTLIWGKLLLEVIAPTLLLRLDTQLVGQLSGTPAIGNTIGFVGGGHFIVAPGCSSLHNMSLALLLAVCG